MTALLLAAALTLAGAQDAPAPGSEPVEQPAPGPTPEPAPAPAVEPVTVAAPTPAPGYQPRPALQLDEALYTRQMQLARVGIGVGAASVPLMFGGAFMMVAAYGNGSPALGLGGLAVLTAGGVAFVVGPSLTVAGSLYAAARLQDAGIRVPTAAGWVGFGLLVGSVIIPFGAPLSYIGSGIQMATNAKALREAGWTGSRSRRPVDWTLHVDRDRVLRVSGVF